MKNLLLVLVLLAGFSIGSNAQTVLNYELYNTSSEEWHFAMDDAGTSPALYELNIAATTNRFGSLNVPFQTFTLPLDWKAVNENNCYVSSTIIGQISTSIGTSCPGVDIDYKLVQVAPFLYVLKMQFN